MTGEQLEHFSTFGFLVFRGLLTQDEISRYAAEFDRCFEVERLRSKPIGNGDRAKGYAGMMDEHTPFMAALSADPRFAATAEQLIGTPSPWCIACDGQRHVGADAHFLR
eukprot:SAG31_NODE_3326_length_4408_cov_3.213739_3_plen_109_part_00